MAELWRRLKIGDRVRVVEWPPDLYEDRCHPDTVEYYQWLIRNRVILRIVEIDPWGLPWSSETRRVIDGVTYHESVILDHGGLERVTTRKRTPAKKAKAKTTDPLRRKRVSGAKGPSKKKMARNAKRKKKKP